MLESRRGYVSLWTPEKKPLFIVMHGQKLLEILIFQLQPDLSVAITVKIFPVGGKRNPDSHVSNSQAKSNNRMLFICRLQQRRHEKLLPQANPYLRPGHRSNLLENQSLSMKILPLRWVSAGEGERGEVNYIMTSRTRVFVGPSLTSSKQTRSENHYALWQVQMNGAFL